jgi:hypothetical protein
MGGTDERRTRRVMGVSVAPEIPERREARAYLVDLMSDQEAAACVAADLARVWALCGHLDENDGWERDREAWANAAREYHRERGGRVSLLDEGRS